MSVITMTVEEGEFGKLALPHNAEELLEQLRQDVSDINDGAGTPLTVADTTDTTTWVLLSEDQTGALAPKSDGALTYNASTGVLSATAFTGGITVADTTDSTCFPALFESATGNLAPKTDGALLYDASTGVLSANGLDLGNAAIAGAGVLDWYEEGTWTPGLSAATPGTLAVTYNANNVGYYTRIGDKVFVQAVLDIATISVGTASGAWTITGLPFTSKNVTQGSSMFEVNFNGVDIPASTVITSGFMSANTNFTYVRYSQDNATGGLWTVADTTFAANDVVYLVGFYTA